MGYSPWGRKELDMTEATWHAVIILAVIIARHVSSHHEKKKNEDLI